MSVINYYLLVGINYIIDDIFERYLKAETKNG